MAKRLAQCLNPALPSGVHQKTLEVYSLALEAVGVCFYFFQCYVLGLEICYFGSLSGSGEFWWPCLIESGVQVEVGATTCDRTRLQECLKL